MLNKKNLSTLTFQLLTEMEIERQLLDDNTPSWTLHHRHGRRDCDVYVSHLSTQQEREMEQKRSFETHFFPQLSCNWAHKASITIYHWNNWLFFCAFSLSQWWLWARDEPLLTFKRQPFSAWVALTKARNHCAFWDVNEILRNLIKKKKKERFLAQSKLCVSPFWSRWISIEYTYCVYMPGVDGERWEDQTARHDKRKFHANALSE